MSSGLWKSSFEDRRCLIPGTAFAEATGRNPATYHWFRPKGVELFAFAGIWQERSGLVGDTAFALLTQASLGEGHLELLAPSRFVASYVRTHLMGRLLAAVTVIDVSISKVNVTEGT